MAAIPYIPPSFGQPGVSISYRPKSLLPSTNPNNNINTTSTTIHNNNSNNDNNDTLTHPIIPIITLEIPPASIHGIFAHRQWRAGMLLSDALYSRAFSTSNLSILELGAGTGLPSITAALLGDASVVVASDYDEPSLVKQLRNNVTTNLAAAVGQGSKPKCKVVGHIWGKDAEELTDALPRGVTGFDRIFLADCLWDPLSHQDLLKTIVKVLVTHEASRVNVIAGLHTGRDNVTSFIRRAYRVGLRLAHIERPDLWPTLSSEAAGQADPDAQRPGNEALEHATQRILELEVCGNTPIQVTTEPSSNGDNNQAQRGHDEPRLTGITRPFLIEGYGAAIEGDVKLRNRWLTVWSLEWANL